MSLQPQQTKKTVKIFQVFYDENSRKNLDPQFIPFENLSCNKYFENQVIENLFDQGQMEGCDYFGVVSWRIWQKVKKVPSMSQFINQSNRTHDFYYANWWWKTSKSIWMQTENWTSSDLTSWPEKLIQELGYQVDFKQLNVLPSFYNYQICRTDLYRDYVKNFLKPIKSKMEDPARHDLQDWLNQPVDYTRSPSVTGLSGQMLKVLVGPFPEISRQKTLSLLRKALGRFEMTNRNLVSSQELAKITGLPHYTRHSFVMEALFPTYAALKGWSGKEFSK